MKGAIAAIHCALEDGRTRLAFSIERALKDTGGPECEIGYEAQGISVHFATAIDAANFALRLQYRLSENGQLASGEELGIALYPKIDDDHTAVQAALALAKAAQTGQILVEGAIYHKAANYLTRYPSCAEDELQATVLWDTLGDYTLKSNKQTMKLYSLASEGVVMIQEIREEEFEPAIHSSLEEENSPISKELATLIGVERNVSSALIEKAFEEKLRFYESRIASAIAKPVRLRNEDSLRKLMAGKTEIDALKARDRISEILDRVETSLTDKRLNRAKLLLEEVESLIEKGNHATPIRLKELKADLDDSIPQSDTRTQNSNKRKATPEEAGPRSRVTSISVPPLPPPVEKAASTPKSDGPEPTCRHLTLTQPSGRLLHILTQSKICFGRDPSSDYLLYAVSPKDKEGTNYANRCISRNHFEIRQTIEDAVAIDGWSSKDSIAKPSTHGILINGSKSNQEKLLESQVSGLEVGNQAISPHLPKWSLLTLDRLSLSTDRPAGLRSKFHEEYTLAAIFMRRLDLFEEDLLILWGEANLRILGCCQKDLWLSCSPNGNINYWNGDELESIKPDLLSPLGFRVCSVGSLEQIQLFDVF